MAYKIQLETVANTQALDKVVKGLEKSADAADDAAKSLGKVGKAADEAEKNLERAATASKSEAAELDRVAASAEKAADKVDDLAKAEAKTGNPKSKSGSAAAGDSGQSPIKKMLEDSSKWREKFNKEAQDLDKFSKGSAVSLAAWGTVATAVAVTARAAFKGFMDQNPEVGRSISKLSAVAQEELGRKLTVAVETVFGANAVSKLKNFADKMAGPIEQLKAMGQAAATFKQTNIADELHKAGIALDNWNDKLAHREDFRSKDLEQALKLRKEMLEDDLDEVNSDPKMPESEKTRRRRELERAAGYDELDLQEADRAGRENTAEEGVRRQAEEAARKARELDKARDIVNKRDDLNSLDGALKEAEGKSQTPAQQQEVARLKAAIDKLRGEIQEIYRTLPKGHGNELSAIDSAEADKKIDPTKGISPDEANQKRAAIFQQLLEEAKSAREELEKQQRELDQLKDRNVLDNANSREIFESQSNRADRQTDRTANQQQAQEEISEARNTLSTVEASADTDAKKLVEGLKALEQKKRGVNEQTANMLAKLAASIEDGIAPGEIEKVQRALSNMGGEINNGFSAMASGLFNVTRSLEGSVKQIQQLTSRIDSLESSTNASR